MITGLREVALRIVGLSKNNMEHNFYEDKLWEWLDKRLNSIVGQIDSLSEEQGKMGEDIVSIKEKMKWIFGFAAGITLVFNASWQLFKDRISKLL